VASGLAVEQGSREKQQGRVVNIVDAFEIAYTKDKASGAVVLDQAAFEEDFKLFKEAFKSYECLGWYCTGAQIDAIHAGLHTTMKTYNERPLFLLFDSKIDPNAKELAVAVYEQVVHVTGDKVSNDFVATSFKIESEEAERVTAVHCAKAVNADTSVSVVPPHYTTLQKAVVTLNTRVKVVQQYLRDVSSNKIEADQRILRQIKGLCARLPTMNSPNFKDDFLAEYNDALLVTYLAAVTKSTTMANEVVDKFNTAFASQRRRNPLSFF